MQEDKTSQWVAELAITAVFFIPGSFVFPVVAWVAVVGLFHKLEELTGYKAPLVGEPDAVDPGAVLVVLIYLVICIGVSALCYREKWFFCAGVIGIGSLFFSVYIFTMVSSLIWL